MTKLQQVKDKVRKVAAKPKMEAWYGQDKGGDLHYVCSLVWGKYDAIFFAGCHGLKNVRTMMGDRL